MCLAAADDVTRRRCVRIIEAASAGGASSSLPNIASSAALTPGLFMMRSLPAVNAVLAALGIDWQRELMTPLGRPVKLADGTPVVGLISG